MLSYAMDRTLYLTCQEDIIGFCWNVDLGRIEFPFVNNSFVYEFLSCIRVKKDSLCGLSITIMVTALFDLIMPHQS